MRNQRKATKSTPPNSTSLPKLIVRSKEPLKQDHPIDDDDPIMSDDEQGADGAASRNSSRLTPMESSTVEDDVEEDENDTDQPQDQAKVEESQPVQQRSNSINTPLAEAARAVSTSSSVHTNQQPSHNPVWLAEKSPYQQNENIAQLMAPTLDTSPLIPPNLPVVQPMQLEYLFESQETPQRRLSNATGMEDIDTTSNDITDTTGSSNGVIDSAVMSLYNPNPDSSPLRETPFGVEKRLPFGSHGALPPSRGLRFSLFSTTKPNSPVYGFLQREGAVTARPVTPIAQQQDPLDGISLDEWSQQLETPAPPGNVPKKTPGAVMEALRAGNGRNISLQSGFALVNSALNTPFKFSSARTMPPPQVWRSIPSHPTGMSMPPMHRDGGPSVTAIVEDAGLQDTAIKGLVTELVVARPSPKRPLLVDDEYGDADAGSSPTLFETVRKSSPYGVKLSDTQSLQSPSHRNSPRQSELTKRFKAMSDNTDILHSNANDVITSRDETDDFFFREDLFSKSRPLTDKQPAMPPPLPPPIIQGPVAGTSSRSNIEATPRIPSDGVDQVPRPPKRLATRSQLSTKPVEVVKPPTSSVYEKTPKMPKEKKRAARAKYAEPVMNEESMKTTAVVSADGDGSVSPSSLKRKMKDDSDTVDENYSKSAKMDDQIIVSNGQSDNKGNSDKLHNDDVVSVVVGHKPTRNGLPSIMGGAGNLSVNNDDGQSVNATENAVYDNQPLASLDRVEPLIDLQRHIDSQKRSESSSSNQFEDFSPTQELMIHDLTQKFRNPEHTATLPAAVAPTTAAALPAPNINSDVPYFMTASQKTINISEDALAKASEMFKTGGIYSGFPGGVSLKEIAKPPGVSDTYLPLSSQSVKTNRNTGSASRSMFDDDKSILSQHHTRSQLHPNRSQSNFASQQQLQMNNRQAQLSQRAKWPARIEDEGAEELDIVGPAVVEPAVKDGMETTVELQITTASEEAFFAHDQIVEQDFVDAENQLAASNVMSEITDHEEQQQARLSLNKLAFDNNSGFAVPQLPMRFVGSRTANCKQSPPVLETAHKRAMALVHATENDVKDEEVNHYEIDIFDDNLLDIELPAIEFGGVSKDSEDESAPAVDIPPFLRGFSTGAGAPTAADADLARKAEKIGVKHFGGFATAKGAPLAISNAALARAKALYDAYCISTNERTVEHSIDVKQFGGFATANGAPLPISDAALDQAKALYDADSITTKETNLENAVEVNPFGGFATAKGAPLPISDAARDRAKALYDAGSINSNQSNVESAIEVNHFGGFATAKGAPLPISDAPLPISDAARDRAKALYDADSITTSETNIETAISKSIRSEVVGFHPPQIKGGGALAVPSGLPRTSLLNAAPGAASSSAPSKGNSRSAPVTPVGVARGRAPFKSPMTPAGLQKGIVGPRRGGGRRRFVENSVSSENADPNESNKKNLTTLFDLTAPASRQTLREAIGREQSYDFDDLMARNVPIDVIACSVLSASTYAFNQNWANVEARKALIDAGADTTLASEEWISNHYKWIVWKFACMIRSKPDLLQDLWKPSSVVDQLCYRYEREINLAHRSALKLIIERDSSPSQLMVLCVSAIYSEGASTCIELTDGWYSIRACLDSTLDTLLRQGKIYVGLKLRISSAKLLGPPEPCPALEVTSSTVLQLQVNSTRLARWDAKLGFQAKRVDPMALKCLIPEGGDVPCIDVIIMRRFPARFIEKKSDTVRITRSEREESLANLMQRTYSALVMESEMDPRKFGDNPTPPRFSKLPGDLKHIENAEDLYDCMRLHTDQQSFMQLLTSSQRERLQDHVRQKQEFKNSNLMSRMQDEMRERIKPRDVSKSVKFRICDYPPENAGLEHVRETFLTIWNPDNSALSSLTEGRRLRIFGVSAGKEKAVNPNRYRGGSMLSVPLRVSKKLMAKEMPFSEGEWHRTLYQPRRWVKCQELDCLEKFEEADLLAVIIAVDEPVHLQGTYDRVTQRLVCTDPSGGIVVVRTFSMDIQSLPRASFLPKTPIAFMNLEFEEYQDGAFIFRTKEDTEIKLSASQGVLRTKFDELLSWISSVEDIESLVNQGRSALARPTAYGTTYQQQQPIITTLDESTNSKSDGAALPRLPGLPPLYLHRPTRPSGLRKSTSPDRRPVTVLNQATLSPRVKDSTTIRKQAYITPFSSCRVVILDNGTLDSSYILFEEDCTGFVASIPSNNSNSKLVHLQLDAGGLIRVKMDQAIFDELVELACPGKKMSLNWLMADDKDGDNRGARLNQLSEALCYQIVQFELTPESTTDKEASITSDIFEVQSVCMPSVDESL
ncbi:hypothetical protein SmJEL517_g04228 [Synchytrium microbalum]|uniref:Tower domain-containing protein n=1 Tax=Synchytrium microbalum TaxID=1806994 RepID=A0A507C3L4_9FUNG|nr:uncharacterized protein SmJEL517_g04228 [Synchytrium microbalum]TPX32694.1 hypothetical protein SmJEL517_g04228 [Synchytrium microbalum]